MLPREYNFSSLQASSPSSIIQPFPQNSTGTFLQMVFPNHLPSLWDPTSDIAFLLLLLKNRPKKGSKIQNPGGLWSFLLGGTKLDRFYNHKLILWFYEWIPYLQKNLLLICSLLSRYVDIRGSKTVGVLLLHLKKHPNWTWSFWGKKYA